MTVSSATQKVQYNGNGSTTVFAYTFKVFNQNDLTVIVRSAAGTETVKTITTHYTVSGVGNSGGGNVTMLTAPTATETITILREQDLVQELDLVENDPFPAQSLEDALDKLTFVVQQQGEELDRSIKASRTNTITSTEFTVSASDRANKIFAFDSAGELSVAQELGTYRGNWATATAFAQRDIVKDTSNNNIYICVTAHTSSGAQPISSNVDVAKWALIVDAASATTSASAAAGSASAAASSASAAATSATNAANSATSASTSASSASSSASTATTQANNAAASAAAAAASFDAFDDIYLGSYASNPTVDNDGNTLTVGDQYFNSVANELRVWNGTTWQAASTVGGTVSSLAVTGVASFADGTAAAPSIAHTGDLNAGLFFPAADTVAVSTAGTERLRLDASGNVGIGTASPSSWSILAALGSNSTGFAGITAINSNANVGIGGIQFASDPTYTKSAIGLVRENANGQGSLVFYNDSNADAANWASGDEKMRINASGSVGIGTSSPTAKLDIVHTGLQFRIANSASSGYGFAQFGQSATATQNWHIGSEGDGTFRWYNGNSGAGTERLRVDSSGNVGIGTTSPSSWSILAALGSDSTGFAGITAINSNANVGIGGIQFASDPTYTKSAIGLVRESANGRGSLVFYNDSNADAANWASGDEKMRINASGNVGIGTSSPITPLHVDGASTTNGVVYKAQAAQTSKAAAATLTIAELLTGIIQYTGAVATLTLPTGTSIEGGLPATFPTNMSFDVSFINTGAALLTIGANGNTTVGTMTVATVTSAMLRFRKTAANTYTVYRIS